MTADDDKFRALLEAAPDAMVVVNAAGTIKLVNAEAERLFGYARDEMVGQPIDVLVPTGIRDAFDLYQPDTGARGGKRPTGAPLESHGRHHDGTQFPVEISVRPLDTPTERLLISAVRDVSERKRADERFRALLESAPDAMVIVNSSGTIVLVNAQTERMFGYSRRELLGQPVEILVPERYRPRHAAHRMRYAASAHPRPMGAGHELFGVRQNGDEFPVEISLSPLQTDEGLLVASAIRDITERKLAEQERARLLHERAAHAEASRVKDEFLATLSHELRTPLNAILGWATLIQQGVVDTKALPKAMATIERNARAQTHLIEDLLDVSRIVTGKLRLQIVPMDACQVVDNAFDVVKPAADAKQLQCQLVFESRPMLMMGDPDRLQQAIWNLLANAVKFSPPRSSIGVHAWTADGQMHVAVRDSGRGIDANFLPHVFDRFRQADSSYTREGGGLGLGLAIVRSIAELHGGSVSVNSDGPGRGATFTLVMPVASTPTAMAAGVPAAPEPSRLDGIKVLVVDDQPDERELLDTVLTARGALVETASSGEAAVERILESPPAILISDIAMPGMDGYALLDHVRRLPEMRQRLPAIAVTAHAMSEDRERALGAGFQAYVSKPLNHGLLIRLVHDLVQRDHL